VARIKKRILNDLKSVRWDAIEEIEAGDKRARQVRTFFTQKEAKEYLDTRRGSQPSLSKPFSDLKENFLTFYEGLEAAGIREASTLKQYREHLKLHIMPDLEFSDRKCGDITTQTVQLFLDRLRVRVSQAMAVKVKATLSQVLGYGAGRGFLAFNPARDAKLVTSNRPEIEDSVEPFTLPSKGELVRLMAFAEAFDNTGKAEVAIRLMMYAGLRASELRGLRWIDCDLDSDNAKITVNQRVDYQNKVGRVKTEKSKRHVPIGPDTVAALKRWAESAPEGRFVLSNEEGKPFTHANLWNRFWVPLLNRAGLVTDNPTSKVVREWSKKHAEYKEHAFGFHMLRHVFASLQIADGVIPKQLQLLMGHATLKLTMDTYGHLWPDDEADRGRAEAVEDQLKAGRY